MSITARYSPSGHLIAQESGFLFLFYIILLLYCYVCAFFSSSFCFILFHSLNFMLCAHFIQTVCSMFFLCFYFDDTFFRLCVLHHLQDGRKTILRAFFIRFLIATPQLNSFLTIISFRMQFAHANPIQ